MSRFGCGKFHTWFWRLIVVFNIACLVYLGLHYYNSGTASSGSHIVVATTGRAVGQANPSGDERPSGSNSRGRWGLQQPPLRFQPPSSAGKRHARVDADDEDSSMTDDDQRFKVHGGARMKLPQVQHDHAHDHAHDHDHDHNHNHDRNHDHNHDRNQDHNHDHDHDHDHRQRLPDVPPLRMPQRPGDEADNEMRLKQARLPADEPSWIVADENSHDPLVTVMDKRPTRRRPPQALLPIEKVKLDADSSADSRSDRGDSSGATLPVYILEEHHEALPYWQRAFDAESKRHGSKTQPLSLVHIDGHSDAAPIMPDKRYPFTAKTASVKNIRYLMTSNDNFIMGSKFAGLVSNGLWIYPKWSSYNATDVDIESPGVSKINGTLLSCHCPHYEQDRRPIRTGTGNSSDTCFVETRMELESRMWFQRKYCYFRKGPFLQISAPQNKVSSEVLSAVLARKMLLPAARPDESTIGSLYKPAQKPEDHNDYLLDIDEDFFGVQLAGRHLVSAGIPLTIVWRLGQSLELLFCPNHTGHEIEADRWFVALLDSVVVHVAACRNNSAECHADDVAGLVARDKSHKKLLDKAACPRLSVYKRRRLIQAMIPTLAELTSEQLRVLQSVGLCLGTSLSTNLNPLDSLAKADAIDDDKAGKRWEPGSGEGPEPIVKLCLGHNLPNESVVQEFLDTRQGLDASLAAMTHILKRLPKPPVAVTVCRSSRDGYIPRQQMSYIESGILAALRSVFGQIEVGYDPNLYYGREGWYDYKAKQLGGNFRLSGDKL